MATFFNVSNHPSSKWSDKQREAALAFADRIVDVQFPYIDPNWENKDIYEHACEFCEKLLEDSKKEDVFHVMGEHGFVFNLVLQLEYRRTVLHSTTERKVVETQNPDGTTSKTTVFEFVRFRNY